MIWANGDNLLVADDGPVLTVHEGGGRSAWLRAQFGSLLLITGGVVSFVFLTDAAPEPITELGWLLSGVFFVLLGIVPVLGGLWIIAGREAFTFDHDCLQVERWFFGLLVHRRRWPWSEFDRVVIDRELPSKRSKEVYVVSCCGPVRRVCLACFQQAQPAVDLSEKVAERTRLPVARADAAEGRT
jgi:hypothetical protein